MGVTQYGEEANGTFCETQTGGETDNGLGTQVIGEGTVAMWQR
jgi:hypothetical protein